MANTKEYLIDEYIVKKYGLNGYKVVNINACRKPGVLCEKPKKGTVNNEKLEHNLGRAKQMVKEYALSNNWDWWCTFTIDPEKYNRYDLGAYQKAFSTFLHSYNKRTPEAYKVRYLLVPEMHKDGAWHMHGFVKGIRPEDIIINENGYLSWAKYNERFGFMSMSPIKDSKKASSYLTKYIDKDMDSTVKELGAHTYYASKGLNRAQILYRGSAALNDNWDWNNKYCRIKWYDTIEELTERFEGYADDIGKSVE